MINIATRLKNNAFESKHRPKDFIDELTVKNWFNRLIVDMEGMSIIGARQFRIFKEMERGYGIDTEPYRSQIFDMLKDAGFVVRMGHVGWLIRLAYIEISWED
jgi:hypothetical protein